MRLTWSMSKKILGSIGSITILLVQIFSSGAPAAYASNFATINISLQDSESNVLKRLTFECRYNAATQIVENSNFSFSVTCPVSNNQMDLMVFFQPYNCPDTQTSVARVDCVPYGFLQGSVDVTKFPNLFLKLPGIVPLTVNIFDAMNKPYTGAAYVGGDFLWGEITGDYVSNGITWTLGSRLTPKSDINGMVQSITGTTTFAVYDTGTIKNIKVDNLAESGPVDLKTYSTIKLCIPINLAVGTQMPSDCYDGNRIKAEADQSAALPKVKSILEQGQNVLQNALFQLNGLLAKLPPSYYFNVLRGIRDQAPTIPTDLGTVTLDSANNLYNQILNYSQNLTSYIAAFRSQIDALISPTKTLQTITCFKGASIKKIRGLSPKCPLGFKMKK